MTPGSGNSQPPIGGGHGGRANAAAFARIAELQEHAAEQRDQLNQLHQHIERQHDLLNQLNETIGELAQRLKTLEGDLSKHTVRAPRWPDLGQVEAETAWLDLEHWLRRYVLDRHPRHWWAIYPCWVSHPDVVDELSALRAAWWEAYVTRSNATDAINWLDRWLPAAMTRIETAFKNCIKGHTGPDPESAPPTWTDEDLAAHLAEDLAGRPEDTAPPRRTRRTETSHEEGDTATGGDSPPPPARNGPPEQP